jgi:hypothetical protein
VPGALVVAPSVTGGAYSTTTRLQVAGSSAKRFSSASVPWERVRGCCWMGVGVFKERRRRSQPGESGKQVPEEIQCLRKGQRPGGAGLQRGHN